MDSSDFESSGALSMLRPLGGANRTLVQLGTSAMQYIEHLPPPLLSHWIKCVWTLVDDASGPPVRPVQPVVPDGSVEIVFHLADPVSRLTGGVEVEQPRALVIGQTAEPTLLRPGSHVRALGIRLHPWGAAALLRRPVSELTGRSAPVGELVPQLEALGDVLVDAHLLEWPRIAFAHLSRNLFPQTRASQTTELVRAILERHGRITVSQLAATANCTTRSVERIMKRDVGLPPLLFARIARVQEAISRIRYARPHRLGRIALNCGYYDQAHFCREFRRLTSLTPTQFLTTGRPLTHAFVYGGSGHSSGICCSTDQRTI